MYKLDMAVWFFFTAVGAVVLWKILRERNLDGN
jgi:hypothetical protein